MPIDDVMTEARVNPYHIGHVSLKNFGKWIVFPFVPLIH